MTFRGRPEIRPAAERCFEDRERIVERWSTGPVPRRSLSVLGFSLALIFGGAPARADVAGPNERAVASQVVFTGLRDFPAYRFVIAVDPHRPDPKDIKNDDLPAPIPVRDGEPVSTDTIYFQDLRAIPADTPDPVTDAWVLASNAPTSGSFTLHPRRVQTESPERMVRATFHVRQIRGGWISLELMSHVVFLEGGSQQPISRLIPVSFAIETYEAPPGWQLYLMPDPTHARVDPPLPVVPCKAGDVLPMSPGPRTLVAVLGSVGPDGSLDGKTHLVWGRPLDPWRREEVPVQSAAVAQRVDVEVVVRQEGKLEMTVGRHFQDAQGRLFWDDGLTMPVDVPEGSERWGWWPVAGGGAAGALLLLGLWTWRGRRKR